jgi:hypothetical protein
MDLSSHQLQAANIPLILPFLPICYGPFNTQDQRNPNRYLSCSRPIYLIRIVYQMGSVSDRTPETGVATGRGLGGLSWKGGVMMNQEDTGNAAVGDAFVEHAGFAEPGDELRQTAEPLVVLARFPNLRTGLSRATEKRPVVIRRWLNPRISFWLLGCTTALLLIAAVTPYVMPKKGAVSDSANAGSAWQPTPSADARPWDAHNTVTASPNTRAANAGRMTKDAQVANDTTSTVQASFGAIPGATTEVMPATLDEGPLTWESFCRRYDQQIAMSTRSPSPKTTASSIPATSDPMPTYRTTGAPDLLTVGPPITASAEANVPMNPYRK